MKNYLINIFINYISFVTFGIIMTSFTMLNVYRAVISSKKIFEIHFTNSKEKT